MAAPWGCGFPFEKLFVMLVGFLDEKGVFAIGGIAAVVLAGVRWYWAARVDSVMTGEGGSR